MSDALKIMAYAHEKMTEADERQADNEGDFEYGVEIGRIGGLTDAYRDIAGFAAALFIKDL